MTTNERFHQSIQDLLARERSLLLTGFADLDDYCSYHDSVRRDPEFNSRENLLVEFLAEAQERAFAKSSFGFIGYRLGFRSIRDYVAYKDSLGRPYGAGFESLWEPETCKICDGIHGGLCPIESPDPAYYGDEMRDGR